MIRTFSIHIWEDCAVSVLKPLVQQFLLTGESWSAEFAHPSLRRVCIVVKAPPETVCRVIPVIR